MPRRVSFKLPRSPHDRQILPPPTLRRQNTIVGQKNDGEIIYNTPTGTDTEKKALSPSPISKP